MSAPQPSSLTRHLLDLGHTRIAFASGPEHYLPAREKEAGWRGVMALRGFPADGQIAHEDFTVEGGLRAASHAAVELTRARPGSSARTT